MEEIKKDWKERMERNRGKLKVGKYGLKLYGREGSEKEE